MLAALSYILVHLGVGVLLSGRVYPSGASFGSCSVAWCVDFRLSRSSR